MKKICPKCKIEKNSEEFRTSKNRKDGLQVYCKLCDNDLQHMWYLKNKDKVIQQSLKRNKEQKIKNIKFLMSYLDDKKCEICGINNKVLLDFHHIKNNKEYNISTLIGNSWSLSKIKNEITKCIILCCNCHRLETAKQQNWLKLNWDDAQGKSDGL